MIFMTLNAVPQQGIARLHLARANLCAASHNHDRADDSFDDSAGERMSG
jgi:hypothetical protein